jgi:hypothetical protein
VFILFRLQQAPLQAHAANYTLELMKMGPKDSYLCFVPNPSDPSNASVDEEPPAEAPPTHSWALLQPLTERCLYVRHHLSNLTLSSPAHVHLAPSTAKDGSRIHTATTAKFANLRS